MFDLTSHREAFVVGFVAIIYLALQTLFRALIDVNVNQKSKRRARCYPQRPREQTEISGII
jgi:hypothetical protein